MQKNYEGNLFQRLPFLTWKLSESRLKSIKNMVSARLPSFNLIPRIIQKSKKSKNSFGGALMTSGSFTNMAQGQGFGFLEKGQKKQKKIE